MLNAKPVKERSIGVAGCGSMGLPMARRLVRSGFRVAGFDIRPPAEFGDFGPQMLVDPDAFAAGADIIISVVRDMAQTRALCFDVQAIFRRPRPPSALVISSTLSPAQVHAVARELPDGTALVDAPMSGAPIGAERGTLTFMLGGTSDDVEYLMPIFAVMGRRAVHLGDTGAGMTAKVLNNYVAGASVVAVRRVLAAAAALQLDRSQLLNEVMRHSSGNTWYGSNFDDIAWSREGYSPDNTMGIVEKDVRCAIETMIDAGLAPGELDGAVVATLKQLTPYV